MRTRAIQIIAACIFVCSVSTGHAQSTPIRYNEGPGLKLSDSLVFHPGLSIEMRYDSNVLFTNRQLQGAPYLRLIGHLELATLSPQRRIDASSQSVAPQKIEFRLKGAVGYREYLSGDDAVVSQRAFEVDAGLMFRWSPSRYFNLNVRDNYVRVVTPQNGFIVQGAPSPASSATIQRNQNRLLAGVGVIPGGGRLSFNVGYALNVDALEGDVFSQNNRVFHELNFVGRWRLLPKTALSLEVIQQFYDYYNATPSTTQFVGSKPLRIMLGFSGLFTPRLRFLLKVGYGNGIYNDGESFNSVLIAAELGYRFTPMAKAAIGYNRSFSDSIFGNYYADHQAYIKYDHLIASRFVLRLSADYRYRSFSGDFSPYSLAATGIDTNLFTAGAGFDWQIRDWVYIGLGYDLQVQAFVDDFSSQSGVIGLVDFVRHQVYGKVGVSY